ncbi:Non-specific lipid-transfer protein [Venturia inaequalis]|nr:Non-specific lipid-transfer protein [Venturia inaequalis]
MRVYCPCSQAKEDQLSHHQKELTGMISKGNADFTPP